jgi:DNA invertase Pin-like site-specific DNA recombinase
MGLEPKSAPLVRAAQYVRMSTDHQNYSTANQSAANHAYAASRGMEIVRTYADQGRSGLSIERRDALQQLIKDVVSGNSEFTAILVYDVSRWGRFQDPDESAYHEYVCKRAGFAVHYCAEQFENDGSSFSALYKTMKRAAAADFSRDLSVKVFAGHKRLFALGFRQGATAPFGMRRVLIDQSGARKCVLAPGERKSIQNDRVILVPGPPEEAKIVRWIFSSFVERKISIKRIARILNARKIANGFGSPWTFSKVNRILKNEIYIGDYVWNRTSIRLGGKLVHNRPEDWLRSKCTFKAIVDPSIFRAAQGIMRQRLIQLSDEEKLEPLRRLLRKRKYLSTRLINKTDGVPSSTSYFHWFGGLRAAYKLVGYDGLTPLLSDKELLQRLRRLLKANGDLTENIIDKSGPPYSHTYRKRFGSISRAYQLIGFKVSKRTQRGKREATLELSNDQLLKTLQSLLRKRGHLSARLIARSRGVPSAPTYARRFGSLPLAYELVGFIPGKRMKPTARTSKAVWNHPFQQLRAKTGRSVEAREQTPEFSTE